MSIHLHKEEVKRSKEEMQYMIHHFALVLTCESIVLLPETTLAQYTTLSNSQIASCLYDIGRNRWRRMRRKRQDERVREPTWQHKGEKKRAKNAIHIQPS